MSFSYQYGANPPIDFPRLLVSDTQDLNHIFEDSEIVAVTNMQALNFQSAQFYSYPAGANLPSSPVSYLRIAAMLLDAIAANKARLSSITQLLDVHLSPALAQKALRDQADNYRQIDDDAGAFSIIEQCATNWAVRDRWWAQIQRQAVGT